MARSYAVFIRISFTETVKRQFVRNSIEIRFLRHKQCWFVRRFALLCVFRYICKYFSKKLPLSNWAQSITNIVRGIDKKYSNTSGHVTVRGPLVYINYLYSTMKQSRKWFNESETVTLTPLVIRMSWMTCCSHHNYLRAKATKRISSECDKKISSIQIDPEGWRLSIYYCDIFRYSMTILINGIRHSVKAIISQPHFWVIFSAWWMNPFNWLSNNWRLSYSIESHLTAAQFSRTDSDEFHCNIHKISGWPRANK